MGPPTHLPYAIVHMAKVGQKWMPKKVRIRSTETKVVMKVIHDYWAESTGEVAMSLYSTEIETLRDVNI